MNNILRIAVQKSGRLSEDSHKLIEETGIKLTQSKGKLIAVSSNFPVEILYLRDDDIPQYVSDGVADIGIVGENEVLEKNKEVKVIKGLGFSKCRMSLAVPKNIDYKGLEFFNGKNVATSYPFIISEFFKKNNIKAKIHEISGSVEITTGIGLADAIFDIVSSGSTLISNGLKEVEIILRSEAVLIANKKISKQKQEIINDWLFRINAVQEAIGKKYILLNVPNNKIENIISLLPGMKSPTILPLAKSGWSSIHSVITDDDFWGVIGQLKASGAQGILVIPIEKMII